MYECLLAGVDLLDEGWQGEEERLKTRVMDVEEEMKGVREEWGKE